jgi:hypothetical protein
LSGIYLEDGYPEDYNNIRLPSISLEHAMSHDDPFQLGGGLINVRRYDINVYARTDGERDDLGEIVRGYLKKTMTIYDYNEVLNNNNYITLGLCDFNNIFMSPQRDDSYQTTKHQMHLSFECVYAVSSGSSLIN